jgi:predicted nucleic acid-binding protein
LRSAFVLDSSIALSWCFADEKTPESAAILELLNRTYALVPALFAFRARYALTQAERRNRLKSSDRDTFLENLRRLPIHVEQRPLLWICRQILPLTRRYSRLTAYDAAYLELALREGLSLATLDADLRAAARLAGVADAHP